MRYTIHAVVMPGGETESCAHRHGGPKCEVCVEDKYYFAERDARCHDCAETWRTLGWVVTAVAAAALVAAVLFWLAMRRGWVTRASIQAAQYRVRAAWTLAGMQPKLKQTISFVQVAASVS